MLLSDKQADFVRHMDGHRWCFKGGATRSGKTYLDFRWIIPIRIRERVGKPGLVVLLGVTKSTIERNVLAPMREIYGDTLVGTISSDNTIYLFGERCYCLGAEKLSQVSKIRGASIKYCYGDEVADWSQEVFELLKSRLDRAYSVFDGTFNPQGPSHWLKAFLDSGADIFAQTYTIDDNPFVEDSFKAALKQEYQGTVFYDRYILGLWALAEGIVYPMFSPAQHLVQERGGPGEYYLSIDYGTINPTAMGLWRVWEGRAVMEKEYYYDSRAARAQKTDEEYYQDLAAFAGDAPIRKVIIDPSAASFKECIRRHGRYTVMDANNHVVDGIRYTASLLSLGRVQIHESCTNMVREFAAYRWDEEAGEDKVIKEQDHAMDQMRYLCQTLRWTALRDAKPYDEPERDEDDEGMDYNEFMLGG